MKTQIQKKCPECKKKVTVLWRQVCGIRTLVTHKGREYYHAKCPDCGHEWDARKN